MLLFANYFLPYFFPAAAAAAAAAAFFFSASTLSASLAAAHSVLALAKSLSIILEASPKFFSEVLPNVPSLFLRLF